MLAYQAHPSVVCTVLEAGGVLLHLDTKFYYSLNRTALAIWLALENGGAAPASALATQFTDTQGCEDTVRAFLAELESEKLVESAPASAAVPFAASLDRTAWEKPTLTRHLVPLSQIMSNPFDPCVPLAE